MSTQMSDDEMRKKAVERVRARKGFFTHLTIYVIINAFLWTMWAISASSNNWMPGWGMRSFGGPVWVTAGWGLGLLFHFFGVFVFHGNWEDREVQKEIDRMKKSGGS